jgi:hypothetical protein
MAAVLGQSSSDNVHEVTQASLIPHIQALVTAQLYKIFLLLSAAARQ